MQIPSTTSAVLRTIRRGPPALAQAPQPREIRRFPKIRSTFLGVPIRRTIVFWGLYWGPLLLGNYHFSLVTSLNIEPPHPPTPYMKHPNILQYAAKGILNFIGASNSCTMLRTLYPKLQDFGSQLVARFLQPAFFLKSLP